MIPVYSIHHDPKIYKNPEAFNPDRFSASEKAERHPFSFLPFGKICFKIFSNSCQHFQLSSTGEGPRVCIGMRFALIEAKVGLSKLLQNFEFTLDQIRTPKLKIKPNRPILSNEGGVYMKIKKLT